MLSIMTVLIFTFCSYCLPALLFISCVCAWVRYIVHMFSFFVACLSYAFYIFLCVHTLLYVDYATHLSLVKLTICSVTRWLAWSLILCVDSSSNCKILTSRNRDIWKYVIYLFTVDLIKVKVDFYKLKYIMILRNRHLLFAWWLIYLFIYLKLTLLSRRKEKLEMLI